ELFDFIAEKNEDFRINSNYSKLSEIHKIFFSEEPQLLKELFNQVDNPLPIIDNLITLEENLKALGISNSSFALELLRWILHNTNNPFHDNSAIICSLEILQNICTSLYRQKLFLPQALPQLLGNGAFLTLFLQKYCTPFPGVYPTFLPPKYEFMYENFFICRLLTIRIATTYGITALGDIAQLADIIDNEPNKAASIELLLNENKDQLKTAKEKIAFLKKNNKYFLARPAYTKLVLDLSKKLELYGFVELSDVLINNIQERSWLFNYTEGIIQSLILIIDRFKSPPESLRQAYKSWLLELTSSYNKFESSHIIALHDFLIKYNYQLQPDSFGLFSIADKLYPECQELMNLLQINNFGSEQCLALIQDIAKYPEKANLKQVIEFLSDSKSIFSSFAEKLELAHLILSTGCCAKLKYLRRFIQNLSDASWSKENINSYLNKALKNKYIAYYNFDIDIYFKNINQALELSGPSSFNFMNNLLNVASNNTSFEVVLHGVCKLIEQGIKDPALVIKAINLIVSIAKDNSNYIFDNIYIFIKALDQFQLSVFDLPQNFANAAFGFSANRIDRSSLYFIILERLRLIKHPDYHDPRPLAVIQYPVADWNGAFNFHGKTFSDLLAYGYRVIYIEVGADRELIKEIKRVTRGQQADILILSGHGMQQATSLGTDYLVFDERLAIDFSDEDMLQSANLDACLKPQAKVFLQSCSVGQGKELENNIANIWKRILKRKIFAPSQNGHGLSLIWKYNQNNKAYLADDVIWDNRDYGSPQQVSSYQSEANYK
ncbi:MAG: caspase family protein, partial [Candidatus Margulisbacteria bacterium]|nr:caspase family protein [Candidatus Margulisiibacteriota bacterium]